MIKRLWWIVGILLVLITGCASPAQTATVTATAEELQAGATRVDKLGVEQVWVPAGSFLMGTDEAAIEAVKSQKPPFWVNKELPSETPQHKVQLTKGYWIDTYEITNASFQKFVDDGGYQKQQFWSAEGWAWVEKQDTSKLPKDCGLNDPNLPRVCVTWYEAEAYARWRGGQLPTEAQWEYAARGPDARVYPWGNEFDPAKTNLVDSYKLVPVGSYPSGVSWVGAHDMAGNAMEWVQDWLDPAYYQQNTNWTDPTGPESGSIKIEKGGWWGSNPFVARSAYRHFEDPPTYQDHHIGFRVVTFE